MALASALAFGLLKRIVAAVLLLALIVFTGAAVVRLRQGRAIDCGCFGRFEARVSWGTVARNLGLITLTVVLLADPGRVSQGSSLRVVPGTDLAAAASSCLTVLGILSVVEARRLRRAIDAAMGRSR